MSIQITIIGLGQIGASVGMALAEHKELFNRVGHDREPEIARQAQKQGVVDRISINLPASVRGADIVLLSLPMDQIRETLEVISPDLKEGAVVMDTGPVKEVVAAWAGELLPPNRYYVGLTPVLNPEYLFSLSYGLEAAHADLFKRGMIAIVAPPRTASDAIKLAADLSRLLGATTLFADPVEIDSLMAATHVLPQLVSAALLNATVGQPGWREARKVAGRAYAEVTGPSAHIGEPKTLRSTALLSRENVVRVLDGTIAALQALRNDIETEDAEGLESRLARASNDRLLWWSQRQTADWGSEEASPMAEISAGSEIFGRLLGVRRRPKPKIE